jgi:hypothetical protein
VNLRFGLLHCFHGGSHFAERAAGRNVVRPEHGPLPGERYLIEKRLANFFPPLVLPAAPPLAPKTLGSRVV